METRTGRLNITGLPVEGGRAQQLVLSGHIDESSDLRGVIKRLRSSSRLLFDLESVSCINSLGVREWVRLVHMLAEEGVDVVVRRCSEVMVQQMNMIPDAMHHVTVESFQAPYECLECGNAAMYTIDVAEYRDSLARLMPPSVHCAQCDGLMTFIELPERYFLFLQPEGAVS
jgi:anti-anti-sigma regulatory factor